MYSNANQMRELQRRHVFNITDWCISIRTWLGWLGYCSAVVVYNSQKNQLILFPLTVKMKQLFLKRVRILLNVKQLQVRRQARRNQPSPSAIDG